MRLLRSMRAAVVIFAGSGLDDPALKEELARHIAAMRPRGRRSSTCRRTPAGEPEVGVDNAAGIAAMVAALVGLGHRRIAFLAGPPSLLRRPRRASPATARAWRRPGIEPDERLVVGTSFDREGGALGVDELLASGAGDHRDRLRQRPARARGDDAGSRSSGSACPDDVSVAGFDDISVAAITAPSLSTVRLPLRDLGRRGLRAVDA